jgi:hypothetical protein
MDQNPENNIRLFLKRLRARLRGQDAAVRWPVEEGWQELKARIVAEEGVDEEETAGDEEARIVAMRGRVLRMRYRIVAAAVVILLLIGGGYFVLRTGREDGHANALVAGSDKAVLPPTKGVQLVLSDGRRVSVDKAQTLTEKGGVAIQTDSGSVDYQAAAAGVKGAEIAFNTLEVPRGNKSRITLPDGTKVWINAASRLRYPTVFAGDSREVELEGEAYFDVSKDAARSFIVHARGMDIRVLGTAFNVNTYDSTLYTTLVSGKVSVKGKADGVMLEPGEQARVNGISGETKKSLVNAGDFTAWKDNDLYIGNLSFDKVVVMLARQYDYEIELSDPSLEKLHFTIDMPQPQRLQDVLEHICSTTEGIKFSISGRKVTFSRTE